MYPGILLSQFHLRYFGSLIMVFERTNIAPLLFETSFLSSKVRHIPSQLKLHRNRLQRPDRPSLGLSVGQLRASDDWPQGAHLLAGLCDVRPLLGVRFGRQSSTYLGSGARSSYCTVLRPRRNHPFVVLQSRRHHFNHW